MKGKLLASSLKKKACAQFQRLTEGPFIFTDSEARVNPELEVLNWNIYPSSLKSHCTAPHPSPCVLHLPLTEDSLALSDSYLQLHYYSPWRLVTPAGEGGQNLPDII